MTEKRRYRLVHDEARRRASEDCKTASDGWIVTISEPTRTLDQNAKFHAICSDLAKSDLTWAGRRRDADEWKALLVSGHAVATKAGGEVVPGLEGEFVSIRESTSQMNKTRASSLIEYAVAFCAAHGIEA